VHIWWGNAHLTGPDVIPAGSGQERVDLLGAYRELGVRRTMQLLRESVRDDEALPRYAEDARAAGVELA
jgi:hypothetical protein